MGANVLVAIKVQRRRCKALGVDLDVLEVGGGRWVPRHFSTLRVRRCAGSSQPATVSIQIMSMYLRQCDWVRGSSPESPGWLSDSFCRWIPTSVPTLVRGVSAAIVRSVTLWWKRVSRPSRRRVGDAGSAPEGSERASMRNLLAISLTSVPTLVRGVCAAIPRSGTSW